MSWTLTPARAGARPTGVNVWSWRPVLAMLERDGRLDPDLLERLAANATVEVDPAVAELIAVVLDAELARVPAGRILLDGSVRLDRDSGEFHREDVLLNYTVDVEELRELRDFCRGSDGFVCA